MLSEQIRKFTSATERSKLIAFTTLLFALLYHILIQATFYKLNVNVMFFYNFFSISCFLGLLIAIKKVNSMIVPYIIACMEVIAHQILSDIYLGTYSGFHYFILLIGLLPFLVFGSSFKLSLFFSLITSTVFVILENIDIEPLYIVSNIVIKEIRFFNIFFSVAMILVINLIYTFIVYVVEKNLEQKNKNLDNEIKMASVIQQSFFKQDIANLKGVDIACYSRAMAGVSGDIYDVYKNGDEIEGVAIFDVSGHGISSGLVTMLVKNIIEQEFSNNKDLELWEILNNINDRVIEEKGDIENYLTGILVRYLGNKLEIAIAGHPNPIFYQKSSGRCVYFNPIKESVGAIGISDLPVFYTSDYIDFEVGDEIILYSDGVCDVVNEQNISFGSDRLLKTVKCVIDENADEQIENISKQIRMFRGKKHQNDDITVIVLKKTDE